MNVDWTADCFNLPQEKFAAMSFGQRLDHFAKWIVANGMTRPSIIMQFHFGMMLVNYLSYAGLMALLLKVLPPETEDLGMLLFAKFLVWQHLAEALGCRQGPLMGSLLPDNFRYRLSRGTLKYTLFPSISGSQRNRVDQMVHSLFFLCCLGFIICPWYNMLALRLLMLCDVYLFCFDMTQFYASTAHAYGSMLLALCFPAESGRLAGVQLGLLLQWFFSGVGKIGPWFEYVNGPFMLQSRWLRGQPWLQRLLVTSEEKMTPTSLAKCLAHLAAAAEYVAPVLLMIPFVPAIWLGFFTLLAMHLYILLMPAPFDVYSWNLCFGCSNIYLFCSGHFGFDHQSFLEMNHCLKLYFMAEFVLCCYGNIWPDEVGYYLSHRYWAGNWVQSFFFVKKTERVNAKLDAVAKSKGIGNPLSLQQPPYLQYCLGYLSMAYLWLATFNMKCFARLFQDMLSLSSSHVDDWQFLKLSGWLCGDFRDELYAKKVMPAIQEECKFEEGEAYLLRIGAFSWLGIASWQIFDLSKGAVKEGTMTIQMMKSIDSLPTQALQLMMD